MNKVNQMECSDKLFITMADFLHEGVPLHEFRRQKTVSVFEDAQEYPDFFKTHLVDPHRVIKVLEDDPHSCERIFYYQYLKLCEELEKEQSSQLIDNILQLMIHPEFVFIFPDDQQQHPFTDSQFKRFVYEFLAIIEDNKMAVDAAVSSYPIIDIVFTYLLRSLLIFNEKAETMDEYVDHREAFANLSAFFGLEIQEFGNCIKFVDSDVFVFEENQFKVYMAYIKDPSEIIAEQSERDETLKNSNNDERQGSKSVSISIKEEKESNLSPRARKKNQLYVSNTSSGIYDFIDFTSNVNEIVSGFPINLSSSTQNQRSKAEKNSSFYKASMELPSIPKQVAEEYEIHEQSDLEEENGQEVKEGELNQFFSVVLPGNRPSRHVQKEEFPEFPENIRAAQNTPENCPSNLLSPGMLKPPIDPQAFSEINSDDYEHNDGSLASEKESMEGKREESQKKRDEEEVSVENQSETNLGKYFNHEDKTSKRYYYVKESHLKTESTTYQEIFQSPRNISINLNRVDERIFQKSRRPKLNVTEEFTNSFLMRKMKEPFQSSTYQARERARAYRKSIFHL